LDPTSTCKSYRVACIIPVGVFTLEVLLFPQEIGLKTDPNEGIFLSGQKIFRPTT
jgi:hypothetical protein